jgi:hypothetical protein
MGCPDLHKSHLQTLNETGRTHEGQTTTNLSMYSNSREEGYPRIQYVADGEGMTNE